MKLEYIVNDLNKYENLKQVLKEEFLMSDRLITKLKSAQKIFINNEKTYINRKLNINDLISIDLNFIENSDNIIPKKMNLNILYEDDCFLIVDKPPFMPVHPSINHYEDSLSNGIKYYFDSLNLEIKIRPINRLDKDTSGIVLFAKNAYIQECLVKQMNNGTFEKYYLALFDGVVDKKIQVVDLPIARKEKSIIERCVSENGDDALTIIEVKKTFTDYSLVKCTLKTGRTHQIRVHSKYIGNPVLGDDLYGRKSKYINRQALHAYKVKFIHPITKENIEITSDLPSDFKKLIK